MRERSCRFSWENPYNISSLPIVYPVRLESRVEESSRHGSVLLFILHFFFLHACGFICMCHNNFPGSCIRNVKFRCNKIHNIIDSCDLNPQNGPPVGSRTHPATSRCNPPDSFRHNSHQKSPNKSTRMSERDALLPRLPSTTDNKSFYFMNKTKSQAVRNYGFTIDVHFSSDKKSFVIF